MPQRNRQNFKTSLGSIIVLLPFGVLTFKPKLNRDDGCNAS